MSGLEILVTLETADWPLELEPLVHRAARAALATRVLPAGLEGELGVTLSDDATVQALNRDHRNKDRPTNVLSFPLTDGTLTPEAAGAPLLLGDVILAFETVAAEAAAQGKSLADHTAHLVVHGVLHLLGHDHEDDDQAVAMERLEVAVLAGLTIADPYACSPSPLVPQ